MALRFTPQFLPGRERRRRQAAEDRRKARDAQGVANVAGPIASTAGTVLGGIAGGIAGSVIPGAGTMAGIGLGAGLGGQLGGMVGEGLQGEADSAQGRLAKVEADRAAATNAAAAAKPKGPAPARAGAGKGGPPRSPVSDVAKNASQAKLSGLTPMGPEEPPAPAPPHGTLSSRQQDFERGTGGAAAPGEGVVIPGGGLPVPPPQTIRTPQNSLMGGAPVGPTPDGMGQAAGPLQIRAQTQAPSSQMGMLQPKQSMELGAGGGAGMAPLPQLSARHTEVNAIRDQLAQQAARQQAVDATAAVGTGMQVGQSVLGGVGDIISGFARNEQLEGEDRDFENERRKDRRAQILSMLR